MTWEIWLFLGSVAALILYAVLRLLYVWTIVGGGGGVDAYKDSEK